MLLFVSLEKRTLSVLFLFSLGRPLVLSFFNLLLLLVRLDLHSDLDSLLRKELFHFAHLLLLLVRIDLHIDLDLHSDLNFHSDLDLLSNLECPSHVGFCRAKLLDLSISCAIVAVVMLVFL